MCYSISLETSHKAAKATQNNTEQPGSHQSEDQTSHQPAEQPSNPSASKLVWANTIKRTGMQCIIHTSFILCTKLLTFIVFLLGQPTVSNQAIFSCPFLLS